MLLLASFPSSRVYSFLPIPAQRAHSSCCQIDLPHAMILCVAHKQSPGNPSLHALPIFRTKSTIFLNRSFRTICQVTETLWRSKSRLLECTVLESSFAFLSNNAFQ